MAPVAPLGKKGLIKLIQKGPLPVWFGSPHPHHAVIEQDGVFRLRKLEIDQEEARRDSERARAAGESWMPEHYYALGKPVGAIVLEAPSLKALLGKIEAHPWPDDW
jgi:hypothetical protein